MSEKETGGPAFGQVVELRCVRVDPYDSSSEWEPEAMMHGGLTVRDYFIAKALQGLVANPACVGMNPREMAEYADSLAGEALAIRAKDRS